MNATSSARRPAAALFHPDQLNRVNRLVRLIRCIRLLRFNQRRPVNRFSDSSCLQRLHYVGRVTVAATLGCLLLSACSTRYTPPQMLDPDTGFPGLVDLPAQAEGRTAEVLLVHGICTHDARWAQQVVAQLVQSIDGASISTAHVASAASADTGAGAIDMDIVPTTVQTPAGRLRFTALIWSPLTTPLKRQLCYDQTDKSAICTGAPPYPYQRARLNARLKDSLIDDCLPDALIYQGVARDRIQLHMRDAILTVLGDSEAAGDTGADKAATEKPVADKAAGEKPVADKAVADRAVADKAASGHQATANGTPGTEANVQEANNREASGNVPLVIIAHSMGSKIMFDTLLRMTREAPDSRAAVTARRTMARMRLLVMAANQIPLLSLAEQPLDAPATVIASTDISVPDAASATANVPAGAIPKATAPATATGTVANFAVPSQTAAPAPPDSLQLLLQQRGRLKDRLQDAAPLTLVAFTDPNDLLSYTLPPERYAGQGVAVVNILVSNAPTWLGLLERPDRAHLDYLRNPDVGRLIACGVPSSPLCKQ